MIRLGSTGPRPGTGGWARLAAALMLAASLASCAPAETGLQRDAARQLQERVLSVSQAAAANDPAAALQALDALEAELSTAAGEGKVSEERRRTIMTVVTAVRADLTSALEAAAAAKAAEEAAAAEARAEAEATAKASQEAAAPVPPAPARDPAPEPAPGGNDKGNEGKGKGKDG